MNKPIAYGIALFLVAWAVAAFAYEQPWAGVGLLALAAALAVWVTSRGQKM